MRQPRVLFFVRWLMFILAIVGADLAAMRWVIVARDYPTSGSGSGPISRYLTTYEMYDGSRVTAISYGMTGMKIRRTITPATPLGLCRVWWPAVAGGVFTALAIAFARTRKGRWFITEMPLPRMTTRRWMVVVVLVGTEVGLIVNRLRASAVDPFYAPWPQILLGLLVLHFLAFLPVGLLLLYRYPRGNNHQTHRDRSSGHAEYPAS